MDFGSGLLIISEIKFPSNQELKMEELKMKLRICISEKSYFMEELDELRATYKHDIEEKNKELEIYADKICELEEENENFKKTIMVSKNKVIEKLRKELNDNKSTLCQSEYCTAMRSRGEKVRNLEEKIRQLRVIIED